MSLDRFPLSSQRLGVTVTVTSVGAAATPGTMNGTTRLRITATPRVPETPPRRAAEPAHRRSVYLLGEQCDYSGKRQCGSGGVSLMYKTLKQ